MRPSNPIINVHRPTLSWRTRVLACALVRLLQSLAKDPRRAGVSLVSLKPPLHGPASVVCLHSSRAYDGLARAPTCSGVALTLRRSKRCPSKTARRLRRRPRSLVTDGTSRRRSHLRLHIPGVRRKHVIRRPIPALPSSRDRDDSTLTSISGSGLSSSGLHSPYIGHTGRSTVIPKNSHYERLYSGMSPCTTQYTGDVFEHSPLTSVGFQEVHVFVSRQQLVTSIKSGSPVCSFQ